jgi:hypothetical protein
MHSYLLGLLSETERKNGWTPRGDRRDTGPGADAAAAEFLRLGQLTGYAMISVTSWWSAWDIYRTQVQPP